MKELKYDKIKLDLLLGDDIQKLYLSFKDDLEFRRNICPSYFDIPGSVKNTWNDEYYSVNYGGNIGVGYINLTIGRWRRSGSLIFGYKEDVRKTTIPIKSIAIIIKYAFEELGIHRLSGSVYEYNIPCKKILDKFFTREGTARKATYMKGEYYNTISYGLLKCEYDVLKNKYGQYFNRIG